MGYLKRKAFTLTVVDRTTAIKKVIDQVVEPFHLYPNPAQNEVTFKFENEFTCQATIILIDVLGKVLGSYPLPLNSNHEATLNVSDLPNGLYYYTIKQPNAANITGKLTVLK